MNAAETSCVACSAATKYAPATCKWWLEQPSRAFSLEIISAFQDASLHVPLCQSSDLWGYQACQWGRSSYSIHIPSMNFIGLPFWIYGWFSATVLSNLVTLTVDLFYLELVHNVSRGMDNHPANFGASATFHCRIMGKHTLDWRHDLITLQFFKTLCHPNLFVYMIRYIDFWFGTFYNITARQWNESLYSIPVPSMKFVGLPFGRYGAFYISALIGLQTMTFQPLHGVMSHLCHGLHSCQFSACYALSWLRVRHGRETDRRTDR